MNNKISNISFQANLVTSMKGRNGVMVDVAKKFAEKTKGLTGTFEVKRGMNNSNRSLVLKYKELRNSFVIDDYADLMGAKYSEISDEIVENIAECYSRIFRMLKVQSVYDKVNKKRTRSVSKTESALNANRRSLKQAKENGENRFEGVYQSLIEQNKQKLNLLDEAIKSARVRYLNMLGSIAGEDLKAQKCAENILK